MQTCMFLSWSTLICFAAYLPLTVAPSHGPVDSAAAQHENDNCTINAFVLASRQKYYSRLTKVPEYYTK